VNQTCCTSWSCPNPSGPGELRIRIHAAAVNPTDTLRRNGARAAELKDVPMPRVPGMDGAGVLEEIGEGVATDLKRLRQVVS
jgi:NADPH:quinone reductase